ncbi:MAG: TolB family protein [Candidatus Methylomirabilales bacterium]
MRKSLLLLPLLLTVVAGIALAKGSIVDPREGRHLANVRQLTFGGSNAEAYFSWDGSALIFQSTQGRYPCDQIFTMRPNGTDVRRVSTGRGRTTCSFFLPGNQRVIYASTHMRDAACPPKPDRSDGYVWALYDYDIYIANADGSGLTRLTDNPAYDAEGALSPDGKKIVFTSLRAGDLDIYTMDTEGRNLRRLTFKKGFDGGAFFSWDGTKIVYRAHHPEAPGEMVDYERLLSKGLMRPTRAEIFVMDADGENKRQLTDNGSANWAPAFHPNGRQVIFSSNLHAIGTRNFDLYIINIDGTGLERISFGGFNSFPFFSPDGKKLVFSSDRFAKSPREFNIFIADWISQMRGVDPPAVRW